MDAIEMSMVFGTASGYGQEINEKVLPIDIVAKDLLSILEQVKEETGIYVSGNLSESRSLYHPDWGCPENGEKVYEYCGSANPLFIPDPKEYIQAAKKVALLIKEKYNQSSVYLSFRDVDLDYISETSRKFLE